MQCARLNHFVRFNPNGTVSRCGHMDRPPKFNSLAEMDSSKWMSDINEMFDNNVWPEECKRCQQTESINNTSIRINANEFHDKQIKPDYLCVGGVLDNICNSACQFCNAELSTKIGSLESKNYIMIDNSNSFWQLPLDRIVHLDINGGEPSASKNYKYLLNNLPANVRSIRVNTNCSSVLTELSDIAERGIDVTVTVSFDGIGKVHDYIRWPIPYNKFIKNLMQYKSMPINLNLWTTVNALNIGNFNSILAFVKENDFNHSWALLQTPDPLNVKYSNWLTNSAEVDDVLRTQVAVEKDNTAELREFLAMQDANRKINFGDFYEI